MKTGIKKLDILISRYGITASQVCNEFQFSAPIRRHDPSMRSLNLPYCFHRLIESNNHEQLILYRFKNHTKNMFLAAFLVDEAGNIVERVYYQRKASYVEACKAIECELVRQLKQGQSRAA